MIETDYRIMSMMIAPALFMTATGSLVLSSNNRLARIVDRIRVLIESSDKISQPSNTLDFPDIRLKFMREEIEHLKSRSKRIRNATALLYLAFAIFVSTSLGIGIDQFLNIRIATVTTIMALAGVCALLWACIYLFREARIAVRMVDLECDFRDMLLSERERLRTNTERPSGV